jgi:D-alanine-D-alanine ligase
MKKKIDVLVIFDLPSPPPKYLDLSRELDSADWKTEAHVVRALTRLGHRVRTIGLYDDPGPVLDEIKTHRPDVVFNLAEQFKDRSANDRNVVGLLEMMDVRYTGSSPTGLTLCKNKGMTKEILSYHRIDFPDFAVFPPSANIRKPKQLDYPLFIKPLKDEASYGIAQDSFVRDDRSFEDRVRFIHERLNQQALAEEYIEGRELYVSIIGNRRLHVLPIREVIFSKMPENQPQFATFKAKWDEEYRKKWGIKNIFAQDLPEGIPEKISVICKKVYQALHIRGYGRIDLRLTPEGRIVVLEANPNPGLAPDDEVALSALKAGYSYEELVQWILRLAFVRLYPFKSGPLNSLPPQSERS